jgi:hypothetical protein
MDAAVAGSATPTPTPMSATTPAGNQNEAPLSSSVWTTKRKIGMGMAGASAAGAVAGIVLGMQATSKRDEAHQHCSSTQTPCADAILANKLIEDAKGRALGANIAFGGAGALAIGAGVLWFTGASEAPTHHVAVAPSFAPGEAGVVVFGRF